MTTAPELITEALLAEVDANIGALSPRPSMVLITTGTVELMIATIRQQRADDASTTGNKYRAELYAEVWSQARLIGYRNVTDALAELERRQASERAELERLRDAPVGVPDAKPLPELMMASYHEAIGWNACRAAMLAVAPAAPAPAAQKPVAVVDANDDGMWADILPDVSAKVGDLLYSAPPDAEQPHQLEHFTDACGRLHTACNKVRAKLKEMDAAEQTDAVKDLWPDEIHQMAFEEGQPAENGDGYLFTAEEFDLFVERLLSRVKQTASDCEWCMGTGYLPTDEQC